MLLKENTYQYISKYYAILICEKAQHSKDATYP